MPHRVTGGVFRVLGPPVTNNDSLIYLSGGLMAVIDWFAFTIPVVDGFAPSEVAAIWGRRLFGAIPSARGRMGYVSGASVLGSGLLLWSDEHPDMGVHVELPSSALGSIPPEYNLRDFLVDVAKDAGHCTRLDVALDTDLITVQDAVDMNSSGELVSKTSKRSLITDLETGAMTLYIGAAQSRKRVRIYDKALESGLEYPLTRIEVQFRAEFAQTAFCYLLSGRLVDELLFSAIDFRQAEEADSNKSRWVRASWWAALTDGLDKLSFAAEKIDQTLDSMYQWIAHQVAPTLAMLCVAFGGWEWLYQVVSVGSDRLSNDKWAWLAMRGFERINGVHVVGA